MRKLLLFATLLLTAFGLHAQTSLHIQPGYCKSSGPLSHCGFTDENGVAGLVNSDYHGYYINYGTEAFNLPAANPNYTDLTRDSDTYPVILVQAQSDGYSNTVTVTLHGYRVTQSRGRITVHTAYITSGTVTVTPAQ